MRKQLFIITLLVLSFALPQRAFSQSDFADREMYGFFLRNSLYEATYGFAKFNVSDLQNAEFTLRYNEISSIKGDKAIFAGACANDVYYAYEYDYNPYGPKATEFVAYNLVKNKRTVIAPYQLIKDGQMMGIQDMTYDYKTNKMYALCFDRGLSLIMEVNLDDGKMTEVCELTQTGCATLAADVNGDFYTIGQDGILYKIDIADGMMTEVMKTNRSGMLQLQTMEFDRSNNMLYWPSCTISFDEGEETYMLRIDIENKTVTDLGKVGAESCLIALYIPFADGGDEAPGKPTDLKVVPADKGARKAELSWTNPTVNFVNEELTSIGSVVVERNDVEVAVFDNVKIGEKMSFVDDKINADGECKYSVYARNANGNGSKATEYVYVGIDVPVEPTNIRLAVGEFCQSAEITWNASNGGLHNGFINTDEITYKVIRMPDAVVVANNIKETKFVDNNIDKLQRYAYKVYACNSVGESGAYTLEAAVLGNPHAIPYKETYEDLDITFNTSTYIDGNLDYCTWVINSPAGYYQFGDSQFCLEHIINPGFEHSGMDADEWMITPPFLFDGSKSYKITFDARSIREENFEFTIGDRNAESFHKKFTSANIVGNTDENYQDFHYYEIDVPAGTAGVKCLGLHLVTPFPANNYAHLQLMNISVVEGVSSGIGTVENDLNVRILDNMVYTGCDNAMVEVYDAAGMKVIETIGAKVSLNNLANGMYIVRVINNNGETVKKYMVK